MKARLLLGAVAATVLAAPAFALDVERYEGLVDRTVEVIEGDQVNVAEILGYVDELIAIGVEGVHGFAADHPEFADAMAFVASSVEDMKALNLESIEDAWHEGEALEAAGFDTDALYDDDHASIYMEAVIHPATAHLAALAYKITGDDDYLDQVEFELVEIVDHFEDLEDEPVDVVEQVEDQN